ncbi:hypothetical protein PG994_005029 [Apiospora phragmitis]|uniref:Uncharacterized protein n=1 Tax=Apiospora phragmitis TaxID=2905665 RepID=A0ABR1VS96_9PEZI
MPTTRSSEKTTEAIANGLSDQTAGAKHEIEEKTSPAPKRAKKDDEKTQKTIEETMPDAEGGDDKTKKTDDANDEGKADASETKLEKEPEQETKSNGKEGEPAAAAAAEQQPQSKSEENGASAVGSEAREGEVPSSILEKGIVYFFIRGRVGIDDPSCVADIARTYLVLRPHGPRRQARRRPHRRRRQQPACRGAQEGAPAVGQGPLDRVRREGGRVLRDAQGRVPRRQRLRDQDGRHAPLAGGDAGRRGRVCDHVDGRESHLAYMLTLPEKLGEAQKELGLRMKGSFILSTRNPDYPPPKYAQLPEGPDYPQQVKDDFRSLRWSGTTPKHLDYVNTQFLLIGESSGIDKAMEPQKQDQKDGSKEEPEEELVKLEEEDAQRMKDLSADDSKAIFADLGASAKDYPKLQTTF